MNLRQTLALAFLLGLVAGLAGPRLVSIAHACVVATPLADSYELSLGSVSPSTETWPATATLDTFGHRIDFSDGTHLVFQ